MVGLVIGERKAYETHGYNTLMGWSNNFSVAIKLMPYVNIKIFQFCKSQTEARTLKLTLNNKISLLGYCKFTYGPYYNIPMTECIDILDEITGHKSCSLDIFRALI